MATISKTKTTKKATVKTPVQQLQNLKTEAVKHQQQISLAYQKATDFVQKQLEKAKDQLNVAKKKLVDIQSKVKSIKVEPKSAKGGKSAAKKPGNSLLGKSKVAITAAQKNIKKIMDDISNHNTALVNLKQDHKRFLAYVQAQKQFIKEWDKKAVSVAAVRPTAKKVVKPKAKVKAKTVKKSPVKTTTPARKLSMAKNHNTLQ